MCRVRGVTGLGSSAAPMPVQGPIGDTNRLVCPSAKRDWAWAPMGAPSTPDTAPGPMQKV
ncbi:hypothetical protein MCOR18_011614, partial [Pyricularia oryzae]